MPLRIAHLWLAPESLNLSDCWGALPLKVVSPWQPSLFRSLWGSKLRVPLMWRGFGDYHSTMMMKTCCLHLATLLARVTLTLWYQWHWCSDLSRHSFHTTPGCLQEKTARFPWRPIRGITWLAHVHSPTMLKKAWENTPNRKHIIWFLIEGLLQNLTDSPGSFTCSFCGLALHELVPTGRCLAARGLKSGMQTQEQLLRVSFPHGRKPLIFFWTKHGRFANKQFPENWAGPHLLVKATPQSCQSLFYPSPLRFGSRALHSVSESDSTMGAKGNQNGS